MKKRFLSLLLIISMLLMILPAGSVLAQEAQVTQIPYSQWAQDELIVGDTYHIYPQSWYTKGMQKPITHGQLRLLLAGLRVKILKTDRVVEYNEQRYFLDNNMTVEEVLEFLYILISDYEFEGDIGIKADGNALDYMAENGIFTGKEGELSKADICTVEQACVIGTRLITHIYNALDAASKGFLWEIESGENTVYLLGSVHLANNDIYPFDNKMLEAFAESDLLGVEVNLLDNTVDRASIDAMYGMYTDGTSLKDYVSDDIYQKTVKVGAAFGLPEEALAQYKPWALYTSFANMVNASTTSTEEASKAALLGIDLKFMMDAYITGKPVIELESYEFQIKMLDSFSDELEEQLLVAVLDAVLSMMQEGQTSSSVSSPIGLILDYWRSGDIEGFMRDIAPLMVAAETPEMNEEDKESVKLLEEYYNKIFTERDKGMADKIDGYLKAEGKTTYFVVVGSGHYVSDYSVIDILEEKGYEINQIK